MDFQPSAIVIIQTPKPLGCGWCEFMPAPDENVAQRVLDIWEELPGIIAPPVADGRK
jgi:hypothetical protein